MDMLRQEAALLIALAAIASLALPCPCTSRAEAQQLSSETQRAAAADLPSNPVSLEPIEVQARPTWDEPSHPTLSTSVLTQEDLKTLTARNVGEALRFLPGVTVTRGTRRNRIRVSIRGFNPRYVRVYVDGVPLNPATDEEVDLSTFAIENIEKIEVIKGPAPVKYGANAMAGVILITTKSGDQNPGVEASYAHSFYPPRTHFTEVDRGTLVTGEDDHGLYNGDRYGITAGGGSPTLNAFAMAARETSEGFRPHSGYENNNFGGKLGWRPYPGLGVGLTGGYFFGERDLLNPTVLLERRGQYTGGGGQGTGPMYNSSGWELDDWKKGNAALVCDLAAADWAATRAMAYHFQESYRLYVQKPIDPETVKSQSPRESQVSGGDVQQDFHFIHGWPLRLEHVLTLGFSGRYESFDWGNSVNAARDQAADDQEASVVTVGVYLQDSAKLLEGLSVVAGVRYDVQTAATVSLPEIEDDRGGDREQTSPHLSFLYELSERVSFHGAAGRTYRFPRLRDLYDYVGGNPDLKPETAWDFEAGADARILPFLIAKVSGFYNEVEDLIYSPGKFIQFQNIGEARFRGIETEISFEPGPAFGAFLNYTYMDAKDLETGSWAPYAPRHKLSYGWTASRWDFRLSYQGAYVSERATGDALTPRLPGYHVADVKLARTFRLPALSAGSEIEVFTAVQNVFDEQYQEILGFPLPGRTFFLGGSCRWQP
ncbi:MAG: TonB-dependent receptor [bacterium]